VNRMYSPEQKRFTSNDVSEFRRNSKDRWNCRAIPVDPAGMMAGPNRYAYAGNNPVNNRDPSGMIHNVPLSMIDGAGSSSSVSTSSTDGGGGSTNTGLRGCPNGQYATFEGCVESWARVHPEESYPAQTCEKICYGNGYVDSLKHMYEEEANSGLPEGAICTKGDLKSWGYAVTCNRKATSYLDDTVGSYESTVGGSVLLGALGLAHPALVLGGIEWAYLSAKIDSCDEQKKRLRINVWWWQPLPILECV